jgi:hypothetical protein
MSKKSDKTEELPEASFSSLLLMLATGSLQNLGLVSNPMTQKVEKNLPLARHTIDTLGILKEKTKGNLQKEEESFLDSLLYDLRMKYMEISKMKDEPKADSAKPEKKG